MIPLEGSGRAEGSASYARDRQTPTKSPTKRTAKGTGIGPSACADETPPTDPDLAVVAAAWSTLSAGIREAILALVRASVIKP
jgi:hypothetical protein